MPRKRSHSEVSSVSSTTSGVKDYTTNENPADTSFVDSIGTDMVDIHVGRDEDKKLFRVHKKRICACSSYFKDCFEKGKRVMRLSDESPKLFDVIIEWVYTDKLRLFKDILSHSEGYLLYQLAELLVLSVAMDKIMTFIRSRHYEEDFYITTGNVQDIYVNTCRDSQLRAYAIELFVYTLRGDTDEEDKVIQNWDVSSLMRVHGLTSDFIELSRKITIEDPRVEDTDKAVDGKHVDKVDSDDDTDKDENAIDSNEETDEDEDEDEEQTKG